MPVPGLDAQRCHRRNRLAARKGFNAVPVKLSTKFPSPIDTNDPEAEKGLRVITATGKMPKTKDAALERINALVPEAEEPLTKDDVHVAYMEAGNSNFIRKYYMFLGESTLRNIAKRAGRSIAFMNSHRTGGISTETELPFGRSFAGRYEQAMTDDGRNFSRVLIGVYMLKGAKPNGDQGPSTDDLYAGIRAGTIFDVSLGIQGGEAICDVCGKAVQDPFDEDYDTDGCPHCPGTTFAMEAGEIKAQLAKGVPDGMASYTLENATAGEVSAVFDGAVPGAGFRKALSMQRSHKLSGNHLAEARHAFAHLVDRGDLGTGGRHPRRTQNLRGPNMARKNLNSQQLASAFRFWQAIGEPEDIDVEEFLDTITGGDSPGRPAGQNANPPQHQPRRHDAAAHAHQPAQPHYDPAATYSATAQPQPAHLPQPLLGDGSGQAPQRSADPALAALQEQVQTLTAQLKEERTARLTDADTDLKARLKSDGEAWAQTQVRLGTVMPAQAAELAALYAQNAYDDHKSPAQVAYLDDQNLPKLGTRVEALKAVHTKKGPHLFATEFTRTRDPQAAAGAANAPAHIPAGTQPPLVSLQPLPHQLSADPLGDQMAEYATGWAQLRNGNSDRVGGPTGRNGARH